MRRAPLQGGSARSTLYPSCTQLLPSVLRPVVLGVCIPWLCALPLSEDSWAETVLDPSVQIQSVLVQPLVMGDGPALCDCREVISLLYASGCLMGLGYLYDLNDLQRAAGPP